MELSRRDAAAALAAIGATGGIALGARELGSGDDPESSSPAAGDGGLSRDEIREAMTAVAEVVYPDEVSGTEAFVDGFLDGRLDGGDHEAGLRRAATELDDRARAWYGDGVADLAPGTIDRLLREVGADTADEDPDGTTAERVRYYVVNDLLLALYASPTGGELVGLENPQGHPGGTDSYQRGPR